MEQSTNDPRIVFADELLLVERHDSNRHGRSVKFLLPADDKHHPFADYDKETRFYAVLVHVDEDEHAVEETEFVRTERKFERAKARGGRHSKLAGILCRDRMFQAYLLEMGWLQPHWRPQTRREMSAQYICDRCDMSSRAELDERPEAFDSFRERIEKPFYKWLQQHHEKQK